MRNNSEVFRTAPLPLELAEEALLAAARDIVSAKQAAEALQAEEAADAGRIADAIVHAAVERARRAHRDYERAERAKKIPSAL